MGVITTQCVQSESTTNKGPLFLRAAKEAAREKNHITMISVKAEPVKRKLVRSLC
jgi:hypothetical protein